MAISRNRDPPACDYASAASYLTLLQIDETTVQVLKADPLSIH